jgi:hypothetical protein
MISMTMTSLVNESAVPNMSTSKFPTPPALSRANGPGPFPMSTVHLEWELSYCTPLDSQAAPLLAPCSALHSLGTQRWCGSHRPSRRGQCQRGPSTTDASAFLWRAQTRTTLRSYRPLRRTPFLFPVWFNTFICIETTRLRLGFSLISLLSNLPPSLDSR